ncbi:MAG: 3-methyl-2-oxobutanoate hydroxymethyltransferase [Candidatus Nanopelagicales bacterium]
MARISIKDLANLKLEKSPWVMLTCYDATMARVFDKANVHALLVGDSAATVVYGYSDTTPITEEELLPLVAAVARGSERALVVADLPFGSYQISPEQALATATRFIKAGANAVKLEGGVTIRKQVEKLVNSGIAVMGHVGLTPQSANALGGYKVQGRGQDREKIIQDAASLEAAGAFAIVLEVIPQDLAQEITHAISIPTIGIGAGAETDAQVLVWQDLLGLTPEPLPKFVERYANLESEITSVVEKFKQDVKNKIYPDSSHWYHA